MSDLNDVIEESLRESQEDDVNVDAQEDASEVLGGKETADPDPTPEGDEETPPDVAEALGKAALEDKPKGKDAVKPKATQADVDEFAKKHGVTAESAPGRENRIPYSRVKKIVEKAEKDARAAVEAEFSGKTTPQLAEYETKIKDYDTRWAQVAQFEQTMLNDPDKFLPMLEKVPAYKPFFDFVRQALAGNMGIPANGITGQPPVAQNDGMPQPDGNGGYSPEGLQKLLEWTEKRVEQRLSKRYEPIEQQWQAQQRIQAAMPEITRKVNEARKWPLFNENEQEITNFLAQNETATLEGAYNAIVVPKLQAQTESEVARTREETRKATLDQVRRAATNTSVSSRTAKASSSPSGSNNLDDIIANAAKNAGLL